MNLRKGTCFFIARPMWPGIHPDDRTPENARPNLDHVQVLGCEWDAPGQKRMQVRLRSLITDHEFCLTRHELEINGAFQ